ncbi:MAG: hypothetical protein ABR974_10255 [Bacteroidales bacterium]|jgi:hypothetical protein
MKFDAMNTFLLILIVLLAAYVIYLHVQLVKKNITIESIVRKVSGIEKEFSVGEIKKFLTELHNFNLRSLLLEDKLFEENILDFIFSTLKDSSIYIHYTMDEEIAKKIMNEGFRFVESFYKTALPVSDDKLDLMIKHNNRKYYGDYIIIICISIDIVSSYSSELERSGIRDYSFENVLTENPPEKNENSDNVFLLSSHFVKGYVNYRTGKIVQNPSFNPGFSSPEFSNNIARLKESISS